MTLQEVKRVLDYVEPKWYDYFLLRFMTGMRSCEVHGLQLKHIDFDHRLIKVRQNMVNGEITDVKTPKSRRDLPINDILSSSLERITATLTEPDDFLFTNDDGEPLDTRSMCRNYLGTVTTIYCLRFMPPYVFNAARNDGWSFHIKYTQMPWLNLTSALNKNSPILLSTSNKELISGCFIYAITDNYASVFSLNGVRFKLSVSKVSLSVLI
ncbi:tyrosine-type recombinase/integrase [Photobacterium leiognathi]|uniref:tyrosine-type recombinase/integrase n=1 Tax=Photobacterium leiognathi TaxID=553611 RepID=UPI00298201A9|nr:tyrosine-type recombinase/integrase [Photobacterium leiognathi]